MKINFKNTKLYISIALFIISVILIIIGSINLVKINRASDIIISQEIQVSSTVKSPIQQIYDTTITGQIQNRSDKTLNNIILTIEYKSSFIGEKGKKDINITTLAPGQIFNIDLVEETHGNFEKIEQLSYVCNNSIDSIIVANKDEKLFNGVALIAYVGAGIAIFFGVKLLKNKTVPIPAKPKAPKSMSANNINININMPQTSNNEPKAVFCKHCGTKNKASSAKCDSCGANLD